MLDVEDSIRDQINHDLDCTEASLRLMALRTEMVELLQQRKIAGGDDRCPTVEERLKENHRPPAKQIRPLRGVASAVSLTLTAHVRYASDSDQIADMLRMMLRTPRG